jgi:hypothetical protein
MQLQMETADLNECDFLETQFSEEGDEGNDEVKHKDALMTGTILYFMKDGRPHYEYEPIGSNSEAWFADAMERNCAYTWMKTIHWRLEKMSCVLVLRNKLWFQHAIQVLDDLWQTILKERINPQGCEHRAPKRRSPVAPGNATNASAVFMHAWLNNSQPPNERKCLFDMSALD